jgi:hypothetical protein
MNRSANAATVRLFGGCDYNQQLDLKARTKMTLI